jgi:hypothetical protein
VEVHDDLDLLLVAEDRDGVDLDCSCHHVGHGHEEEVHDGREKDRVRRNHGHLDREDLLSLRLLLLVSSTPDCC